ncbi:hypothetical protein LWM68_42605 [Niabella sp. W65]|nr:hypothetical protein [Niabella sp. W65]MCH7368838.1 hypothetical protein [Niabella sp. W65]ULT44406.1 hypothetical protein KRR40_14285 [Niabella sp. I65]
MVAWPLFADASVTARGLVLLMASMFSYALGTIYFTSRRWEGLHLLTINGWQTLLGAFSCFLLCCLPISQTPTTFPGFLGRHPLAGTTGFYSCCSVMAKTN